MAHGPNQWGPFHVRNLVAVCYRRLSYHQRPSGHELRRPSRHLFHGHRFQRTHTHQARLRLRSRHTGTAEATVPADPTVQRPITVQSERTRTPSEKKYPTSQRTLTTRSPTPFSIANQRSSSRLSSHRHNFSARFQTDASKWRELI